MTEQTKGPLEFLAASLSDITLENDRALLTLCTAMIDRIASQGHEIKVLQEQVKLLISELK